MIKFLITVSMVIIILAFSNGVNMPPEIESQNPYNIDSACKSYKDWSTKVNIANIVLLDAVYRKDPNILEGNKPLKKKLDDYKSGN